MVKSTKNVGLGVKGFSVKEIIILLHDYMLKYYPNVPVQYFIISYYGNNTLNQNTFYGFPKAYLNK